MTEQNQQPQAVLQNLLGLNSILDKLQGLDNGISKLQTTLEALQTMFSTDETKQQMADIFSSGLKNLLSDVDTFRLVVSVLSDSIYDFVIKASQDEKFQSSLQKSATSVLTSDAVKGSLSEAIFSGAKRLSTDEEVQKALSETSDDVIKSQAVTNRVNELSNILVKNVSAFLLSDGMKDMLSALITNGVAQMKDQLHLSTSEIAQDLRKAKLQISFVSEEEKKS